MVKRLITVIVIAILLLTLGIVECVLVNNFIVSIDNQVNELIPLYTENKNDITILTEKANDIEKKWDDNEQILCLMFNHKDIGILTDTMTRLVEYTKQNNYDDAIVEINILKEYAEKNHTIMGCNIHNIL